MNTIELMSIQRLLNSYTKEKPLNRIDSRLIAASNTLDAYVKRVENPKLRTRETHRVARVADGDKVDVYLLPVFDRLHAIEPTTGVTYEFSVDDDNNILVTLTIDGRDLSEVDTLKERALLHRASRFVEDYISSRKSNDGCLECGAGPRKICEPHCSVLEAEMLLNSIRRLS